MAIENTCEWYDPSCGINWLADEIDAKVLNFYNLILEGFSSLFSSIPVPSFFSTMGSYALPSGVSWIAESFLIPEGLALSVTAYTARFILRRIPVIG